MQVTQDELDQRSKCRIAGSLVSIWTRTSESETWGHGSWSRSKKINSPISSLHKSVAGAKKSKQIMTKTMKTYTKNLIRSTSGAWMSSSNIRDMFTIVPTSELSQLFLRVLRWVRLLSLERLPHCELARCSTRVAALSRKSRGHPFWSLPCRCTWCDDNKGENKTDFVWSGFNQMKLQNSPICAPNTILPWQCHFYAVVGSWSGAIVLGLENKLRAAKMLYGQRQEAPALWLDFTYSCFSAPRSSRHHTRCPWTQQLIQ